MSAYYFKEDRLRPKEAVLCALAAILPDLDCIPGLLIGAPKIFHRSFTHSFLAAILFSLMVYWVSKRLAPRERRRRTWGLGIAYTSHILLDFIQPDTNASNGLGISLFYPFKKQCYQIGWDFFPTPAFTIDMSNFSTAFQSTINPETLHYILLELLVIGTIFGVTFGALRIWNYKLSRRLVKQEEY